MTLLTICQNIAREVGITVPSSIVGNTAKEATVLLRFAQRTGTQIAQAHDWVTLQAEHTFTTADGTAYYDLPAGFRRFLVETAWDRDNLRPMRGPITPAEWQVWKSSVIANAGIHKRWRVKPVSGVKKFYVDPIPSATDSLVFEYVSDYWCQSSGGTAQSEWTADTDTARIDEDLIEMGVIWRMLNRLGRPYIEERAEFDMEVERRWGRDAGAAILSMGERRRHVGGDVVGVPDANLSSGASWGGLTGSTWGST